MAKISYLNLVNSILRRINQAVITDVTSVTGHAQIVTNLINEAQLELFNEENWHSLYTTRTFVTVASTAEYATVTTAGSEFGRTIDLIDTTGNVILIEDVLRAFDEADPDADETGTPTHYAIAGANYRLYPVPAGIYTIRDRYWRVPVTLAANTDTSDLPIEAENCIRHWAWYNILQYMNKFEQADRVRAEFERLLKRAKAANKKIVNNMHVFQGQYRGSQMGMYPPRFPATYGVR